MGTIRDWDKDWEVWLNEHNAERKRTERNRKKALADRAYQDRCRTIALDKLTDGRNRCTYCGEHDTDVLCIDHINDDGHAHRRLFSGPISKYLVVQDFPDDGYELQVLCHNCNARKAAHKRRATLAEKDYQYDQYYAE